VTHFLQELSSTPRLDTSHFTPLPLRSQPLPSQQLQPLEQTIFKGRKGHYLTTHSPALPPSAVPKLQKANATLLRLGCEYLGDLQFSKMRGLIIYAYGVPGLNSYAVLYYHGYFGGMEFYCTFSSGSSLTTSSRFMAYINFKNPPNYFRVHFRCPGDRLYHRHKHHIQTLERWSGHVERIRPSLLGLAQAIDHHLSTRKGLLISV